MRTMAFTGQRLRFPQPAIPPPIPSTRIAYRSFAHTPLFRNAANTIPSKATQPITPSTPPPPTPPKSRLRYFRLLRYFPYKTALAIALFAYAISKADLSMKESIEAILTQFTVPENTWLYLNLNDLHITESPHSDRALQILPFVSSTGKRRMTVLEMTSTIIDASHDPRVKGLVMAFNPSMIEHRAVLTGEIIESHLGMGALSEIGRSLQFFADAKRMQRKAETPTIEPRRTDGERGLVEDYHVSKDVVIAIADNYSIT